MPFTKEQMKDYREKNKEKLKESTKKYREQNKEKYKEYQKKYYRISTWKSRGVISSDYDALYNKYINTNECELCGTCLTNKKHLDHCQNIICGVCNTIVMRKKWFKLQNNITKLGNYI